MPAFMLILCGVLAVLATAEALLGEFKQAALTTAVLAFNVLIWTL